jgi:hypothetical protein
MSSNVLTVAYVKGQEDIPKPKPLTRKEMIAQWAVALEAKFRTNDRRKAKIKLGIISR